MFIYIQPRNIFLACLICMVSQYTFSDPLQSEVIQAGLVKYLQSNNSDLIEMHDDLLAIKKDNPQTQDIDLQILFYEFLISDISPKKQKKKYSALCISRAKMAEKAQVYKAELHALLSACYGFSAESNFFKAASHGIKSGKMMEKALGYDEKNTFAFLIKGIGDYTRPAFAGASKENAKQNLYIVMNLLNETGEGKDLLMESIANFHLGNIAYLEKDKELSLEYLSKSLNYVPDYKRAIELKKKIDS